MDHTIGRLACTPGDEENECSLPNEVPVVRISTGNSSCCLPDNVVDILGWSS